MRKKLRGIHANLGVASKYSNQLWDLIQLMADDIESQIVEVWDTREIKIGFALDARPRDRVTMLRTVFEKLIERWTSRFDRSAEKIAKQFTTGMKQTTESAMRTALKAAGWTVSFKPSPAALQAYSAVLAENVGIIKHIPEAHLARVQDAVWKNVTKGFDRGQLAKDLREQLGTTEKRAKRLANQQARMAKSTFENVRRLELGIEEAIWRHSHVGKEPRPSHVKADGTIYKIKDGLVLDQVRTWPGVEYGCKCFSEAVLPDR